MAMKKMAVPERNSPPPSAEPLPPTENVSAEPALEDILDVPAVQSMMDAFFALEHIGMGILDLHGKVLVATGWQDICAKFHRVQPEACTHCVESLTALSTGVDPGAFKPYRCPNNLWNIATPIVGGGRHMGNLFLGPFFFDDVPPDVEVFRAQARRQGFDEAAYLEALGRVPRWCREKVDRAMTLYARFAEQISDLGSRNLQLTRALAERRRSEERLEKINVCLLGLGPDFHENIHRLTGLCGELLGATCALYNRIDGNMLCSIGQWQTPPGYAPEDRPDGHICYDIIQRGDAGPLVIRDLPGTAYANTDPNVSRYGLKTYWGHGVRRASRTVGSLCVVFQQDAKPTEDDLRILGILASSVGREEERQRAEERLRFHSQLLDSVGESVVASDLEGRILYWGRGAERLYGYSAKEVMGQPYRHFAGSIEPPDEEAFRREILAKGSWHGEHVQKNRGGGTFWTSTFISLVADEQGRPIGYIGIDQDITERKQAERTLRESEERFQQVAETAEEWIWEMDAEGVYTYSNPVVERILGYTPEELVGKIRFHELFAPHVREEIRRAAAERTARKEAFLKRENPIVHKNGHIVILETTGVPILDPEGNLLGYRGTDTDVTRRRQAEETLRRHQSYLSAIVENQPGLLWLKDADSRFLSVNSAFATSCGLADPALLVGKSDLDIWPRELALQYMANDADVMKTGKPFMVEELISDKGVMKWFETFKTPIFDKQGVAIGTTGYSRDITERKQAEAEKAKLETELQQTRKMESVGRLAGGVAHDFNNMLGVILGRVELAIEQVPPSHPIHDDLDEIHKAASRSADLTRQLLAFARKQTVAPKVLDLNETVGGMLKMLQRLIGENISLQWQPGAKLWPVKIDPSQIDQIFANLCVNARAAIDGVGKITIKTGNRTFDEAHCANYPGLHPGEYVQLAVGDTGCGMDRETLSHIFEPFFTTKEVGEGTGLGLATIYGIVKQNNGYIDVCSEPGQGTTFQIYLPRHVGVTEKVFRNDSAPPATQGSETILLVEDEQSILAMTARMLNRRGYAVLAADTPNKAIQLAREHPGKIHLLITDVVMPEMNGRDLARAVQALHPELKLLFMSGYTADVIAHNGVLEDGMNFIQKPFAQQDLAARIRQALDAGGT